MSNANWESPFDTRLALGADPGPAERTRGAGELASLLSVIAGQLAESDRRHTDVLNDVRERLEILSQDTRAVRTQVSGDLGPAFSRIEDALAHLGHRLHSAPVQAGPVDTGSYQPASAAFAPSAPAATESATNAFGGGEAASDTSTFVPLNETSSWSPASPSAEAEVRDAADNSSPPAQSEPTEFWDAGQAEALTQVYETEAPALVQEPEPVQPYEAPEPQHVPPPVHETVFQEAPEMPVSFAIPDAQPQAQPSAQPPAFERDWLEAKFAEIADRIELSLAAISQGNPVEQLGERFEQLEHRFGVALQDVATRSDMETLRILEAQIAELAGHVEQAQMHLVRLDTIEQQIQSVMEQIAQQREEAAAPAAALDPQELERVAELAAEQAASRFSSQAAEQQSGNVTGEVRELIEGFIVERRQGDEQTFSMLDTLQQALIRLLDRVDAIEMAHSSNTGAGAQEQFAGATDAAAAYQDNATADGQSGADYGEAGHQDSAHDPYAEAAQHETGVPAEGYLEVSGSQDYAPAEDEVGAVPPEAFVSEEEMLQSQQAAEASTAAPHVEQGADAPVEADPGQQTDEASIEAYAEAPAELADPPSTKSAIEKLRQDFIADAQRAKAQAVAAHAEGQDTEGNRGGLGGSTDKSGGSKIFGLSPKLLVLAITAVLAVSGATLLFTKSKTSGSNPVPAASESVDPGKGMPKSLTPSGDNPAPKPRSGYLNGRSFAGWNSGAWREGKKALQADSGANAPQLAKGSVAGLRLQGLDYVPDAGDFARIKQQQHMAKLSNHVGATTAQYMTPAAFLPESVAETAPAPTRAAASATRVSGKTKLALPPVTVGPLSLRLAAANGDPSAQFAVAARLAEGKGTNQNFKEAVRWYKRSASQGFAQSQYRLGTLYERGLGTKADSKFAKAWYQRAAQAGNVKAMHNLAVLAAGTSSGAPDYRTAARWFRSAAKRGLADSQYNFGVLYENGLGVKKNLAQAYQWYALAALNGDKEAARYRDRVVKLLTPHQVQRAKKAVADFSPIVSDPIVNDAFAASEDWKSRQSAGGKG